MGKEAEKSRREQREDMSVMQFGIEIYRLRFKTEKKH